MNRSVGCQPTRSSSKWLLILTLTFCIGCLTGFLSQPLLRNLSRQESALVLPQTITTEWQVSIRKKLRKLLRPRARSSESLAVRQTEKPRNIPEEGILGLKCRWLIFTMNDGQEIRAGVVESISGAYRDGLVVALHGHGSQGMGGLFGHESQHIAAVLAREGFRVLSIETRSFGESPVGNLAHEPYVHRLRLYGHEFHGQVLADNQAILDWAIQEYGQPQPVAVVGLSMGGLSAMFLGAIDNRIEIVVVAGMGGSWRNSFSSRPHCGCSIIPGILNELDSMHIFAAMRATRIALELGRYDHSLGVDNTRDIYGALEHLKTVRGVDITVHEFDGGHEHDPPFVVDYLTRSEAAVNAGSSSG